MKASGTRYKMFGWVHTRTAKRRTSHLQARVNNNINLFSSHFLVTRKSLIFILGAEFFILLRPQQIDMGTVTLFVPLSRLIW